MDEDELRLALSTLDSKARDTFRRVLIHDQADRDAFASQLLRYRDGRGDDWADIIDMLTMHPEARRKALRLLGEIEAAEPTIGGRVRRASGEGSIRLSFASPRDARPAPLQATAPRVAKCPLWASSARSTL